MRADALPLGTRILAVADVWDALTSDRPYRPGLTPAAARSVMVSEATQNRLDAAVVQALFRVLSRRDAEGSG